MNYDKLLSSDFAARTGKADTYEDWLIPLKSWFAEKLPDANIKLIETSPSIARIFEVEGESRYIIRVSPIGHDDRILMPQLIQPIFSEKYNSIKIEILPRLERMKHNKYEESEKLKEEMYSSHYCLSNSMFIYGSDERDLDVGWFEYRDPKTRTTKRASMAIDPGEVALPFVGMEPDSMVPTCSEGYPPLERQWEVQCDIVKSSPHLLKLMNGKMPEKLPETIILTQKKLG